MKRKDVLKLRLEELEKECVSIRQKLALEDREDMAEALGLSGAEQGGRSLCGDKKPQGDPTLDEIAGYLAVAKLYCATIGKWMEQDEDFPKPVLDMATMKYALDTVRGIKIPEDITDPIDKVSWVISVVQARGLL